MKFHIQALCFGFLVLCTACHSENKAANNRQQMAADTPVLLKPDTTTVDKHMPVVGTDTASQAPMPVAKPPANVQPK
jgi:hypothetical protein